MNIVLWIVQILLALLFLFAGASKFIMSAEQMAEAGGPDAVQLPMWFVHIIGACEIRVHSAWSSHGRPVLNEASRRSLRAC